jgi:hypothetical protein
VTLTFIVASPDSALYRARPHLKLANIWARHSLPASMKFATSEPVQVERRTDKRLFLFGPRQTKKEKAVILNSGAL